MMENKSNNTNNPLLSELFNSLDEKVDIVYRYVNLLNTFSGISRDYGVDVMMTEQEIHTLGYICKSPGISVTELAKQLQRTKGAISQMANKLEDKKFIIRSKNEENKKTVLLFPTDSGKKADTKHRAYDREKMLSTLNILSQQFTSEEIETYYKIMKAHAQIYTNNLGV